MVTSEHMNQLLKNVLNLIKSHVGVEMAPWMTRIAGFTQQIIINTSEELLKDPFLPLAQKIKKRTEQMFHKEEALRGFLKSTVEDTSQVCNHRHYTNSFRAMLVNKDKSLHCPRWSRSCKEIGICSSEIFTLFTRCSSSMWISKEITGCDTTSPKVKSSMPTWLKSSTCGPTRWYSLIP